MRSTSRYVLLLTVGIVLFCAISVGPQSKISLPTVVLEATNTHHEIGGYHDTWLLVRLSDDGTLEWDKWVGNAWEMQRGSVTAERVSEIKRTLGTVERAQIHDKMGPYHLYIDTSNELQLRLMNSQEVLTFAVINPWSCNRELTCFNEKSLPKNLKTVICEISTLRNHVADEPIDPMCKPLTRGK